MGVEFQGSECREDVGEQKYLRICQMRPKMAAAPARTSRIIRMVSDWVELVRGAKPSACLYSLSVMHVDGSSAEMFSSKA